MSLLVKLIILKARYDKQNWRNDIKQKRCACLNTIPNYHVFYKKYYKCMLSFIENNKASINNKSFNVNTHIFEQ